MAGIHVGCFELFGTDRVRTIRDLKGKTVAVEALQSSQHVFLSSMAAYVGLDPQKDISWVTHPPAESMRLLAEGKVDAFLGFPPAPQELRAKQIGHVVVNSAVDRPWSQYFCCMVSANREFVRQSPVAAKRAVRALLKAADICALEPERAARAVVDKGYAKSYDYALQTMQDVPYGKWRDYDPRGYAPLLRPAPPLGIRLTGEFVRLQVDVIVTHGVPGARADTTATTTIPIVATAVADMVRVGLVASLARPGGNVTGTSVLLPELSGKTVQLLTDMLPGLTGVAVLWNRLNPGAVLQAEAAQTAARAVGLQVSALDVRSLDEIAEALATAAKGRGGAVIVVGDPLMLEHRTRIAQLALQERLPVIFTGGRSLVEAGGFMGYAAEGPSLFKRSAVFVDKILKGAKPADLPVEQPMRFEFVINLKAAMALGITMSPSLLVLADEVIQ